MKIKYDKETDILYIRLSDNPIIESDEERQGIILDFGANDNVVAIEVLNASKKLPQPNVMEYEVV